MKRIVFKLTVILLIIASAFVMHGAAVTRVQEQDVFASVPAGVRERLVERLQQLIEYESKSDAASLYGMLFGPVPKKFSKQEFARLLGSAGYQTLSFTPRSVDQKEVEKIEGAEWRILGDVKVRNDDGSEEVKKAIVYAQLREGEWYFTGILTVVIKIETKREVFR